MYYYLLVFALYIYFNKGIAYSFLAESVLGIGLVLVLVHLKDFIFFAFLFIFSSMVAFSDTSEDITDSSSYGFTTDLIIYGLVGSSILNSY